MAANHNCDQTSPREEAAVRAAAAAAAGDISPLTFCTMSGKWKTRPRYSPILLKLSDKVLLNFFILPIFSAGWEAGIRSHILLLFFQRVWQRTGCVVWSGEERPVCSEPCGASPAELQRADKQETETQRLALLSSTSSETTNAFLRVFFSLNNATTFPKRQWKSALKQKHPQWKPFVICCAFLLRLDWLRSEHRALAPTSFFLLYASQLLPASPQLRWHLWDSLSGFDPQTPPWMRGLEDSRGVPHFYLSRRLAVREAAPACNVLQEEEYFHGEPHCC